jgi:hypothetical protein
LRRSLPIMSSSADTRVTANQTYFGGPRDTEK